jgi:hypothetical protein
VNARDYYLGVQRIVHDAVFVLGSDLRYEEEVSSFPDHRHDDRGGIHPSPPMNLPGVLDAVLAYVLPQQSD